MKSKILIHRNHIDGTLEFRGVIADSDLEELQLDSFDMLVLKDCQSEGRTAADWLLGLELIFRRLIERQPMIP